MRDRNSWAQVLVRSLGGLIVLAAPLVALECTSPDRTFVPTGNAGSTSSGGSAGSSAGGSTGVGGATTKPCTTHPECDDLNDCNGRESCESGACKSSTTLAPDGNFCSIPGATGNHYCTEGNCEASRCGDGYVDATAQEDCDDANDVPGDGCEANCKFTCSKAEDCADDKICNGTEVCDALTHTCKAGTPAVDESVCGTGQWCNGGLCVTAGCGNGKIDGAEKCDDDNAEDNDGCKRDCTLTCDKDEDCGGGNICIGQSTCDKADPAKPVCKTTGALECKPQDACHTAACDPEAGCVQTVIDGDGDGHADKALGECGDDCDDAYELTYTGAKEICKDGKDNNCDGQTDEVTPLVWYRDCDGDTFAPNGAFAKEQCEKPQVDATGCPGGTVGDWTTTAPTDLTTTDCNDGNANVRPGQTTPSATQIPNHPTAYKWDYNCNNADDRAITNYNDGRKYSCTSLILTDPISPTIETKAGGITPIKRCWGSSYWATTYSWAVPACAGTGTLYYCTYSSTNGCYYAPSEGYQQTCY